MKRPSRKARRRLAALAAVLLAVATFPRLWGPALAERVARGYLDLDEPGSASITVRYLSPFRLDVRGVRLGAAPGAPSLERLEARFTPWGLARGRVRDLALGGFAADFSNEVASAGDLVPDAAARADLRLRWVDGEGYVGTLGGRAFGGPLEGSLRSDAALTGLVASVSLAPALRGLALPPLEASLAAALRPHPATNLAATAHAGFRGSSWAMDATAAVETNGAFAADAALPAASLAADDPLVAQLLAWSGATGAVASLAGTVTGAVHVAKGPDDPVASWFASTRVTGLDADFAADDGPSVALRGGATYVRVDGYGPKLLVRPFGIRYRELAAGGRPLLDSGNFWFRADGLNSLLLTEGSTGFCGGKVRIYALHLDLEHLNAGFTLYLDDLDAGRILDLLPGVAGSATGTIHGKIPLALQDGKKVRLRDAYLYSPPGQVGKLRLTETDAVIDNLRSAGVPDSTCNDLRKALADLDYTVLRMDLRQNRDGTGRLAVQLEGAGTDGKTTIPVSLNLGFNGQLQDLVNVGIRASTIGAGD